MATLDEIPILELGKAPISDGAPGGEDVADDEEYMLVNAEVAKLDRIDLGEPDWFQIEQASQNVLRSKSKDVEMATSLGYALFKKHTYVGLAAALGLFAELITNFWDHLYPSRPRRRKARMESYAERLVDGGWFRDARPTPTDFDAIDLCVERYDALVAALKAAMPDDEPDFGKFPRKIKELASERPKSAEAAPAAQAASASAAAAGGVAAGEIKDRSSAVNAILKAASFIRKADPTEPISYGIVRLIKWAPIELPTGDAAHSAEPPDKTLVEALTHQMNNSVWEHLLNGAENAFRSNDPLWLDLQRYVCAAMRGLGPSYAKAEAVVMSVTAGLVQRLGPGVYELTFRDGTALCSGETKMWLESEVAPAQGGGGGGPASAGGDGKLMEASEAARKLAGSGKITEAIQCLRDGLVTCSQRRDRLLWRLGIAELCYDARRLELAAALLEECYEEIRRYHIDEWEPSLAVAVAQTLYRCRKALMKLEKQPTPEALAGVRESFVWLCQLDPLAALAAEPAGK